jgi:FKBP-type peptidyl-prolyl cis-trans isomerase FkpA
MGRFPRAVSLCLGLVTVFAISYPALAVDGAASDASDEKQKMLYALGAMFGSQLVPFSLSEPEFEALQQGVRDAALQRELRLDPGEMQEEVVAFQNARLAANLAREKKASRAFLDEAAARAGATRTESGLVFREIKAGTGDAPLETSVVKVNYEGALRDGRVFDSTRMTGTPATFSLDRVIQCWKEGLMRMRVGGKSQIVCPSHLAYGDSGFPPAIPPGAALAFDLELLEIVR